MEAAAEDLEAAAAEDLGAAVVEDLEVDAVEEASEEEEEAVADVDSEVGPFSMFYNFFCCLFWLKVTIFFCCFNVFFL